MYLRLASGHTSRWPPGRTVYADMSRQSLYGVAWAVYGVAWACRDNPSTVWLGLGEELALQVPLLRRLPGIILQQKVMPTKRQLAWHQLFGLLPFPWKPPTRSKSAAAPHRQY